MAVHHVVTKPRADAAIAQRLKGFCEFVEDDLKGKIIEYVEATAALLRMRKQLSNSVTPKKKLAKLMLEKRKVTLSQANRAERLMDGESLPHTYADYREACLAVISTRQPIEDCTMTGYQKVHLVHKTKAERTKNRKENVDLRSFVRVLRQYGSVAFQQPRQVSR